MCATWLVGWNMCVDVSSMSIVDDVYVCCIHVVWCAHIQNHAHPHTFGVVDFFVLKRTHILLRVFHIHHRACYALCFICWMCRMWEKIIPKNVSASAFTAPGVFFHLCVSFSFFLSPHLWLQVYVRMLACICVSSFLLYTIRATVCVCVRVRVFLRACLQFYGDC